jgi:hypothetical protein
MLGGAFGLRDSQAQATDAIPVSRPRDCSLQKFATNTRTPMFLTHVHAPQIRFVAYLVTRQPSHAGHADQSRVECPENGPLRFAEHRCDLLD